MAEALLLCWGEMILANNINACGQRPLVDTLGSRIIGGRDALPGAWPWQASLQYVVPNGYKHLCGGSLIGHTWVITAAHCIKGKRNPTFWRAVFGINSISDPSPTRKISAVTGIYVHVNFNYITMDNDIALMQLESSITYTDYIQPVCLATRELPIDSMTQCFITGWGTTAPGGEASDILQEAQIDIIPSSLCNSHGWYNGLISSNMICAGYEGGGIDTCQGDSGGPFVCYIPERDQFYQLGVTSFGFGCAEAHHPGVYTRVPNYGRWMATRMENLSRNINSTAYSNTRLHRTTLYFITAIKLGIHAAA
ncbi:transmembrane protease serine 12 [Gastrophryne carolinensis]